MKRASQLTQEPVVGPASYQWLRKALREWWANHGRQYPWRGADDPYAIFLAEYTLQKTQVAKAAVMFDELINKYPTVAALAEAPLSDLERVFSWLGLVKRARFLLSAAQQILSQHAGEIPSDLNSLKRLPGAGEYTANAIACFAFKQPMPVVDSSTARLLKRLLGFSSPKAAWEDPLTWSIAGGFLDREHPVEHNYGLIDLAALVCVPGEPRCHECPLRVGCAYAQGGGK